MRRRLLSGNWYGPTNSLAFKSSGRASRVSPESRSLTSPSLVLPAMAIRLRRLRSGGPSVAQLGSSRGQSFWQRAGVRSRRHEVRVAVPPRHDVHVEVLTNAAASRFAKVEA